MADERDEKYYEYKYNGMSESNPANGGGEALDVRGGAGSATGQ
jgi:hypothetical protein